MTALCRTFLLLSVSVASPVTQSSGRSKRSLMELAGIIKCSTGRTALAYMMYGCYCGLGGNGWPRDSSDWCCHKHDCCYGDAENAGCQTMTDKYQWTCKNKEAECDSLQDRCEKILCQCDRELGRCLREAPYDKKYTFWPDFVCGWVHPTCNMY